MQMTSLRDGEEAKVRRASLQARRIAQADEGRLAMADYKQKQQATLDRTVKLKSLRLAQEAVIVPEPPKPTRARRKSRPRSLVESSGFTDPEKQRPLVARLEDAMVVPRVQWHYGLNHDTNDGIPWTDGDIDDLRFEFKHGGLIESAARFLCRQGTVEDVRQKAIELGLIESGTVPVG